jgi:outer membrane protein assembly factor BamE (lipoprotein component of BamABCDE complex)
MQAGQGRIGARGWLRAALLVAGLAVAACSPIIRDHGYVPADSELESVVVGRDTRETVAEKVGRPSAAGLLNDEGWYYVQSRYRTIGPRAPEEIDRQVVAISFTPAGTVTNIQRFGLAEGRVVTLSRRVTTSNIREVSLVRQLLGSFGRLRAGDLID